MERVEEFEDALITLDTVLWWMTIMCSAASVVLGFLAADRGGFGYFIFGLFGAVPVFFVLNSFRILILGLAFTLVQIAHNTANSSSYEDLEELEEL